MKIAIAQINPKVGDFDYNTSKIQEYISKASVRGVDIVVFGELALCGYPPEDLLFKKSFIDKNQKCLKKFARNTNRGPVVIIGYVNRKGRYIYNSAAVLSGGEVRDIYSKMYLPNYGVFDEKRYFKAGRDIPLYQYADIKFGLSICEDLWKTNYAKILKKRQAPDIMINISASPFHAGKLDQRKKILCHRAKSMGSCIVYSNLVGGQDELIFDGASMVVNKNAKVIIEAARFREDFVVFDTAKKYRPVKKKHNRTGEIYESLILGIKDYTEKNNFKKAVVAVSGGIDSAVTLCLAKAALGKGGVVGLIMPSKFTSKGTYSDAQKLCKNLKADYRIIAIDDIYNQYLESLDPHIKDNQYYTLACQNIQARIRGNILMAFSNRFGYLVLNTGNKSESSVGYCTLYGDMVGGFGVLKDVYKKKVYRLARFINRHKKIIPESTIKRPPSAELKDDQRDEDDLVAYKYMDNILKLYIEENNSKRQIAEKTGYKLPMINKVVKMVDRNEYKRRQSPPGIKITPKAFGKDRRMPITNKFIE